MAGGVGPHRRGTWSGGAAFRTEQGDRRARPHAAHSPVIAADRSRGCLGQRGGPGTAAAHAVADLALLEPAAGQSNGGTAQNAAPKGLPTLAALRD
jgi:hypothetical protein